MNYLIILFVTILSCHSLQVENIKFCINCKYFKIKLGNSYNELEYGKCLKFPKKLNPPITPEYLVTSIPKESILEYSYATTARQLEYMCGEEGKFYENVFDTEIQKDI
uniref:Uncharacterized protein n=1 Tax=viral metagenome TaxID=1070528 RepID=A0A6C0HTZ6_9ZZZZ